MYNSLWYNNLLHPVFSPPNELFAPVWLVLYVLMLISLVLFTLKFSNNKKDGYIYFAIQLLLNIIWPFVFFGARNILFALIVLILLDIFVFLTMKKFFNVCKVSGILFLPYFLWILFATYLNIGYLILN